MANVARDWRGLEYPTGVRYRKIAYRSRLALSTLYRRHLSSPSSARSFEIPFGCHLKYLSDSATLLSLAVLFLIAAFPARLAAQYVDPGSASVLWQLIVAGLFGVLFSVRYFLLRWGHWLVTRLRRGGDERRGDK